MQAQPKDIDVLHVGNGLAGESHPESSDSGSPPYVEGCNLFSLSSKAANREYLLDSERVDGLSFEPHINEYRPSFVQNEEIDDHMDEEDKWHFFNILIDEFNTDKFKTNFSKYDKLSWKVPCGCLSEFMDVFSIPWSQPFLYPQEPSWGLGTDPVEHYYNIVTEDGCGVRARCWCLNDSRTCQDCNLISILLRNAHGALAIDPVPILGYLQALKDHGEFAYKWYRIMSKLNTDCKDYLCIRYLGNLNQPRIYHVVSKTGHYLDRNTSVGPLVSPDYLRSSMSTYSSNDKSYVNNEPLSVSEFSVHKPPRLDVLSAMALSRLVDNPPFPVDSLLARTLEPFRCGVNYLLPPKITDTLDELDSYKLRMSPIPMVAEAHMESSRPTGTKDTSTMEEDITDMTHGNVTITDTTQPSVGVAAKSIPKLAPFFNDQIYRFPEQVGRWSRFYTGNWGTGQGMGEIIARIDMPEYMILNSQSCPNTLPFKQYAFSRTGMELMIQINSMPAQSGMLLIGAMYNASTQTNAGARVTDVASVVQMPHIRLSAGASNSGILYIPWVHQLPIMPNLNSNFSRGLYYYTVFIAVLAPLRTGTNGATDADFVISGRFVDAEFYGQRSFRPQQQVTVAEAHMELAGIAESLSTILGSGGGNSIIDKVEKPLRNIFSKGDCDRPVDIREPQPFYLQQNTSLSLCDGTTVAKSLQLQAECTTSHPPELVPKDDQFNNRFITSVFGLHGRNTTWDTGMAPGTVLLNLAVNPLAYGSTVATDTRVLTPLSALGQYYAGYHGDMFFKFTFHVSKFHSGRVWIRYQLDENLTVPGPSCYYSALVDVQDQQVYTFRIPYQIPTVYAPMRNTQNYREWIVRDDNRVNSEPFSLNFYGSISLIVENPLRAMQTASQTIEFTVEMCGAENFKYLYPVSTFIQTLPQTIPTIAEAHMEPTTGQGQSAKADFSAKTVVSENYNDEERQTTVTEKPILKHIIPYHAVAQNETFDVRDVVKRFVPWLSIPSVQATIPEGAAYQESAFRNAYITVFHIPSVPYGATDIIWQPTWQQFTGNNLEPNMRTWQIARERVEISTNPTISFKVPWTSPVNMLANGQDPTVSRNQMMNYCNGRVRIVLTLNRTHLAGGPIFRPEAYYLDFDVTAGYGTLQNNTVESNFNLGTIQTLMHDGFRFYRGDFVYQLDIIPFENDSRTPTTWDMSMNIFRAIGDTGNFYVFQGFPPVKGNFTAGVSGDNALLANTTMATSTTRAQWRQDSEWMRDLTMEGIESNPGPDTNPDGSPLLSEDYLTADEVEEVTREGISENIFKKIQKRVAAVYSYSNEGAREYICRNYTRIKELIIQFGLHCVHPGLSQIYYIDKIISELKPRVAKLCDTYTEVGESVHKVVTDTREKITELRASFSWEGLKNNTGNIVEYTALITNVYYSQGRFHTCINIAALLSKLGICDIVANHVERIFSEPEAHGNDMTDEDHLANSWVSTVISALLAAFGVSMNTRGWGAALLDSARLFFRDGINVKRFLDQHFSLITDCIRRVKQYLGYSELTEQGLSEDMVIWMEEVNKICEVHMYDRVVQDPHLGSKAFELLATAEKFDRLFVASGYTKVPPTYFNYKNKLQRLVDHLGRYGKHKNVRETPFCLWMYGDSGVGKSKVSDTLAIEIGKKFGVVSSTPIYTVSEGIDHWNGFLNQPFIVYPDFAKFQTTPEYAKEINTFMSLVDCWAFNPPMAELEDKRRTVNAKGVVVVSNFAFPNVTNVGMILEEAFYRRRHLLTKVRVNPRVEAEVDISIKHPTKGYLMASKIPASWYAKQTLEFAHLQFALHKDPTNKNEGAPIEWLSYQEFLPRMLEVAEVHYERERISNLTRTNIHDSLAPEGWADRTSSLPEHIRQRAQAHMDRESTSTSGYVEELDSDDDEAPLTKFSNLFQGYFDQIQYAHFNGEANNVLKCGCKSKIEQYVLKIVNCEYHVPRVRSGFKPQNAFRPARGAVVQDFGNNIPQCLNYQRSKLEPPFLSDLPDGYYHWSDVASYCCHSNNILSQAYFELVNNEIELVVQAPFGVLVLPTVCVLSQTKYAEKLMTAQGTFMTVPEGVLPVTHSLLNPMVCYAKEPEYLAFILRPNVIRLQMRQSECTISGKEDMVYFLNSEMTNSCQADQKQWPENESIMRTIQCAKTFLHYKKLPIFPQRANPKFKSFIRNIVSPILQIFGRIAVVYGVCRVIDMFKQVKLLEAESQSKSYESTNQPKVVNAKVSFAKPTVAVAHMSQNDAVLDRIRSNCITFKKGSFELEGLRICTNFCLVPLHLLEQEGDLSYSVHNNGCRSSFISVPRESYSYCAFSVEGSTTDLAMIKLSHMSPCKKIIGHFVREKQVNSLRADSWLVFSTRDCRQVISTIQIHKEVVQQVYSNSKNSQPRTMNAFSFAIPNQLYRCGAVVVSNTKICGMYVSRVVSQKTGYAACVTADMLEEGLQALGARDFEMVIDGQDEPQTKDGEPKMETKEDAIFIPIAKAEDPVGYSGKSRIEPSPIVGEMHAVYRSPAKMHEEGKGPRGYSIIARGIDKQFHPPIPLCHKKKQVVKEEIVSGLLRLAKPILVTTKEPLPLYTAFAGIDGVDQMSSMKLDTAIGYPLCLKFPKDWKKKHIVIVDRDNEIVKLHRNLLGEYVEQSSGRRKGQLANTYFMDFPKDEILKPGKDTRLINGAPMHHTIDMRRYLMEFFAAVANLDCKIAVGVNVHSNDWAEIYRRFSSMSDEDYKNFGPSFHSEWLEVVEEAAVSWCRKYKQVDDEYEMVVRCLFRELTNARHIAGDLIYRTICGSPSGSYGTDKINSIAGLCYQCYSYFELYGNTTNFWDEQLLVYGDDVLRNAIDRPFDVFEAHMKSIGMTITKDKEDEVTFLKRTFRVEDGTVFAPLPIKIIGDILNYIRAPYFSKDEALLASVDSYISEIFHHGESVFNKQRSQLESILAKRNLNIRLKSYKELFNEKYSTGPVPIQLRPEQEPKSLGELQVDGNPYVPK